LASVGSGKECLQVRLGGGWGWAGGGRLRVVRGGPALAVFGKPDVGSTLAVGETCLGL
jgi:hypothetical protein